MRAVLMSALAALISSGIAMAAHVKRLEFIPEALWGSWAPTSDLCKDIDKAVVVVSAQTYVSPNASCKVTSVSETAGARGPIYSAHLLCSKLQGPTAQANLILVPTKDPNRISMGQDFRSLKDHERCSAGSSSRVQ
jgi:hypothetical protein